jgi:diaminohydroxyphosphoribosylaminopyrimidine deaminase/5-amino-6-(5-phosphoribosylamino)uracil reductase
MAIGHLLRMTQGRPFVQLKMAVSGDGLVAPGHGEPVWVTGPQVRTFAHLLRARADAILVGRKTIADDNPQLTCRLPGLGWRSPLRVVLDPSFKTPLASKLVRSAGEVPVLIIGAALHKAPLLPDGISVAQVATTSEGRLDLREVLGRLHARGITRVMVEGGPTVARAFLDADLVDEVVIARGTGLLGPHGRQPLLDAGPEVFDDAGRWELRESRNIGGDRLTRYRRRDRLAVAAAA